MTAFMVVDTLLKDPELYEQYKLLAKPLVEKFGGQYLARGGKMSVKENSLWTPTRMVLDVSIQRSHRGFLQFRGIPESPCDQQAVRRPDGFQPGRHVSRLCIMQLSKP